MFEQIQQSTEILHAALSGLQERQRIVQNNMANADTPGFQAQNISFEQALQAKIETRKSASAQELQTTHSQHITQAGLRDEAIQLHDFQGFMRQDGNGVDMEQEIVKMAQAQISYNAVSQLIGGRFSSLKYVITEGSR